MPTNKEFEQRFSEMSYDERRKLFSAHDQNEKALANERKERERILANERKEHRLEKEARRRTNIKIGLGVAGLTMFMGMFYIYPHYRVWAQEMRGKAALAEAEQDRKILIEEANANLEAQKLNASAEVERAKGMAQAIEIENGKLTEQYIHYLWVRNIDKMDGEKIYIPTEANMPILEAQGK